MFWKKKKEITEDISLESDDQRNSFRYDFKDDEGLEITFKKKSVTLINISAGGLAFANKDFNLLDFDHINFALDIPNYTGDTSFDSGLRILKIDENNICHCLFEKCTLEHHELIHKYVLEMQKNDLAH